MNLESVLKKVRKTKRFALQREIIVGDTCKSAAHFSAQPMGLSLEDE